MIEVDTCGMACPQPVLMTKKALDKNPEGVDIVVDNNTAVENVSRFLKNSGYTLSISEGEEIFILEARR